jgi:sugar lactone lactonase YvrE
VAEDGLGNLYIIEPYNNLLRKVVLSTGIVSTAAGSVSGYADGPALSAKFNNPGFLSIDASGVVYIAEGNGHRIRKYDPSTGQVSTVAGTGSSGSANGIGTNASFNSPSGIALDGSGNLYVADKSNHRIRKIVLASGEVTTFAGGTFGNTDGPIASAKFNKPQGLAFDSHGNMYVADDLNHRIRKIDMLTLTVSTVAGSSAGYADGSGTQAKLQRPAGIFVDGSGIIYVSELVSQRIRMIYPSGQVVTLAGDGVAGNLESTATATGRFYDP